MVTIVQRLLCLCIAGMTCLITFAVPSPEPDAQPAAWRETARLVHAKFHGTPGTFAHFGDSITETMAFWTPLAYTRKNAPPEMEKAFQTVRATMRQECWRGWKGPAFGNQGGQTTKWAHENVDGWLRRMNPEVALIMFGSNDLREVEPAEYGRRLRAVVQKCLENGTVVILSTIPPRHGYEKKAEAFAAEARAIAEEMGLPLTDFHGEVIKRRPDDWDGALEKFKAYEGYDVPTLLARDGLHPSHPARFAEDYSDEALRSSGYSLRNYLVLMKYAEVLEALRDSPAVRNEGKPAVTLQEASQPPNRPWFPKAPPLAPPAGEVIQVSTADELYAAADRAKPGGTIIVADGIYRVTRPLEVKTDNVTLRSASGDRNKVILDGGNEGELLRVTRCSGVTIADLTVQNVRWNGIKINSDTGVHRLTIRNCVIHNVWQRGVKGVIVPPENRDQLRPTGCRVEYCLFYNDRPKRFADDFADTAQNFNGNYVGGIDVMYARGWTISDNVFVGIHGRTGEARGAIFLWNDAIDCVVERNIIIDCDTGICLGNSSKPADLPVHCRGCVVRNNFVTRAPENGILADYTRNCKIVNNSIYDPESRLGRLIRLVHDNTGMLVANNLVCGPSIRVESGSTIDQKSNLVKDIGSALVSPAEGNLRLTDRAIEAIDRALPLPEVQEDIDRNRRSSLPDIGAHELKAR
jgi:hypothetical protein